MYPQFVKFAVCWTMSLCFLFAAAYIVGIVWRVLCAVVQ